MSKRKNNSGKRPADRIADQQATMPGGVYRLQTPEDEGWEAFREQCRRQMKWPIAKRIKYGFVRPNRPVIGGTVTRVFNTMVEYREWCEKNYPPYMGFQRTPERRRLDAILKKQLANRKAGRR